MTGIRDKVAGALWSVGLTDWLCHHLPRNARFVLAMHGVSRAKDPTLPSDLQPHLDAQAMRAILTWLSPRFPPLSPSDFFDTEKPGVLLTFDDSFANNVEVLLPILRELQAPAVLFVTLQHILDPKDWLPATRRIALSRWESISQVPAPLALDFYDGMTVAQLKQVALDPLITIGSHTTSHPFLSQLGSKEQEQEILGSKNQLEALIGRDVALFAYPTGDYDARSLACVQSAGYKAAFAVDPKNLGDPRYEIPRVGIYDAAPSYLGLKLSGLHRRPIIGNNFTRVEAS